MSQKVFNSDRASAIMLFMLVSVMLFKRGLSTVRCFGGLYVHILNKYFDAGNLF